MCWRVMWVKSVCVRERVSVCVWERTRVRERVGGGRDRKRENAYLFMRECVRERDRVCKHPCV